MPFIDAEALAYQQGPTPTVAAGTVYPFGPFDADGSATSKDFVDAIHEMLYRTMEWSVNLDISGSGRIEYNNAPGEYYDWSFSVSDTFSIAAQDGNGGIPADEDAFREPVPWVNGDFARWFAYFRGSVITGTCTGEYGDSGGMIETETTDCTVIAQLIFGRQNVVGSTGWPIVVGTDLYPTLQGGVQVTFNFTTDVYPDYPTTQRFVNFYSLFNVAIETPTASMDIIMTRESLALSLYCSGASSSSVNPYQNVFPGGTTLTGDATLATLTATPSLSFAY